MCIHGDKSQNERDWVLQGKIDINDVLYNDEIVYFYFLNS